MTNLKFNLLIATSQLNSRKGKLLGTGTVKGLVHLADLMNQCGIHGDIYDLPNGSQRPDVASPFSLNNGFALKSDELDFFDIPELARDPVLSKHVKKISGTYFRHFQDKRIVDYSLKRSILPWILETCYGIFRTEQDEQRAEAYREFTDISRYWLHEFALFEVYKEKDIFLEDPAYFDTASQTVTEFASRHRDRIDLHKYIQFLCFEQRQSVRRRLKEMGVGLVVNLPFGVELISADVYFHPDVFDRSIQVGASPEPEHGYPEQAWGIAAYIERSAGLRRYLQEKMNWLSILGDGIFLDHLVGWCGQYVLPMEIPEDSIYPHGTFLTTDHEKRKENIHWFLDIVMQSGLFIKGEIAGDMDRVKATAEVVAELQEKGGPLAAMAIPRWEEADKKLKPLNQYGSASLNMVETHDTSTLLQYLLNKKGYNDDFESEGRILEFCNRVLGLPFFKYDVPLKLKTIGQSVWFEICRRFAEGSPSEDLVFTLPGLISILASQYRSATVENNINIKPGTSGLVGNGWGNWSYFSPPIEEMVENPFLKSCLTELGQRTYRPFDYFHILDKETSKSTVLQVIYSNPQNRQIVFRDNDQKWIIWEGIPEITGGKPELELLIFNPTNEEAWERVDLSTILDFNRTALFSFQDLNGDRSCYTYSAGDLEANRLFIKLMPRQIHHFLVTVG